jgi:formamidopyrimidine-DNA glycosylase
MPELPEVEHLRATLEQSLDGALVQKVLVHRPDVVDASGWPRRSKESTRLLAGGRLASFDRRGKQLAISTDDGRAIVVHLGMSGQVLIEPMGAPLPSGVHARHRHVVWRLRTRTDLEVRMVFRDPRRFGGVWPLPDEAALSARWAELGVDGLRAPIDELARALEPAPRGRGRAIKAALLDQTVIAGIGNIYADESLHRAGIHPETPVGALHDRHRLALAGVVRHVLEAAVASGGSSLRDYVDADNRPGFFQTFHRVYDRAGRPCTSCSEHAQDTLLEALVVAGRTTVFCPRCQPLVHKRGSD